MSLGVALVLVGGGPGHVSWCSMRFWEEVEQDMSLGVA